MGEGLQRAVAAAEATQLHKEIPMKAIPTKITMFSGKHLAPLALRREDLCIEDVAHHLAMQCRWTGATRWHYSVAQHCVLAARYVSDRTKKYDALMHDSPETYLQDMAKPLKVNPKIGLEYRKAEKKVLAVLEPFFNFEAELDVVKDIDLRLLVTEADQLVHGFAHWGYYEDVVPLDITIRKWSPERAEREFLKMYDKLRRDQ